MKTRALSMDKATFLQLIQREPLGVFTEAEWQGVTTLLLDSLSRFLQMRMEIVGDRQPWENGFCPLVRSSGPTSLPLDIRFAGMLDCKISRENTFQIDALLFVFVGGQRVTLEGRCACFVTCDFLGLGVDPEWVWRGWQSTEFPDEWDPYTFRRFFEGAELELPGCSSENELG